MSILQREDGVRFAVQTYRELLTARKSWLLRNEVRILSQEHGEYVRIFSQPGRKIEAVFSTEPGYLLAESVWYHLEKPTNLVYCEELPASKQTIVIVVRNSAVYLDMVLTNAVDIINEISPLISNEYKYDIYISGNVPLSDSQETDKFFFEPQFLKSFTRLENSLFAALPANKNLELQSLSLALTVPELSRRSLGLPITIAVVALAIIVIWYYMTLPTVQPVISVQPTAAYVDPYAAYKIALATAAPEKQLNEMATIINSIYALPGWQATQITYDGSSYKINATPSGGSAKAIIDWANQKHFAIDLTSAGVALNLNSQLTQRPQPTYIYNIQKIISLIVDRLTEVLPDRVTIGNISSNIGYKSTDITIPFNNISPEVLVLIGKQLANLPVKLSSITVNIQQGGLLNGTIQLIALGS